MKKILDVSTEKSSFYVKKLQRCKSQFLTETRDYESHKVVVVQNYFKLWIYEVTTLTKMWCENVSNKTFCNFAKFMNSWQILQISNKIFGFNKKLLQSLQQNVLFFNIFFNKSDAYLGLYSFRLWSDILLLYYICTETNICITFHILQISYLTNLVYWWHFCFFISF